MKRAVVLSAPLTLLSRCLRCSRRSSPRTQPSGRAPRARRTIGATLRSRDWPTNGGNYYNQRYSPLARIDRANVAQLKGVWRTRLRGSGTGAAVFRRGSADRLRRRRVREHGRRRRVRAVDRHAARSSGSTPRTSIPTLTSVCCGWTNRGVAVSDDKVFVGRLDARLVALDRATGKPVWDVPGRALAGELLDHGRAALLRRHGDHGLRGRRPRHARPRQGVRRERRTSCVWTFYTIPGPGEPGHETWPQDNDAWKYGGASVWQTPAVDPELGLVYFSTGNAGPDYNGAYARGDNLYTASIVAVEAKTGKYRWHFQQVHHDLWDYDATQPGRADGPRRWAAGARKAIAEVGKTGWAYILDRRRASRSSASTSGPCRRSRGKRPPRLSRSRAAKPSCRKSSAIAPEGIRRSSNDGRIFTPFFGRRTDDREAGHLGRRELAAELVRPDSTDALRLRVVGRRRLTRAATQNFAAPAQGQQLSRRCHGLHARCRAPASSRRSI